MPYRLEDRNRGKPGFVSALRPREECSEGFVQAAQHILKACDELMGDQYSEEEGREVFRKVQAHVLRAYPNPNRIGCPGAEMLTRLVLDQLPPGDPVNRHVMECSPCFQEMLDLRAQLGREAIDAEVPLPKKKLAQTALYALAALLIAGVSALFYQQLIRKGDVTHSQPPAQSALNASLSYDASLASGARDAEAPQVLKPMQLVRAHDLHLAITLPLGLDPGDYDTRLCHTDDPNPVCFSTGHATMNKTSQRSLLTTTLRTDRLPPGEYIFFFRRLGNKGWHPLPAQLPALR